MDSTGRARILLAAAFAVVVPVAVSLLVVNHQRDAATGTAGGYHPPDTASNTHLLLAVAAVVGAAVLGGRVAAALKQPPVVGEICAGIMLGPSLLGRIDRDAMRWLFPESVLPMLRGLALIGLVLFMFGVGREFASMRLRGTAARAVVVSAASLLVPFAVGTLVASGPARDYLGAAGNPLAFTIFLGCALSVTAFPVLARILADLRLTGTRVGQLSLFAAALGDGVAWLLLSFALAIAHGAESAGAGVTVLLALGVTVLLLGPVRWALARVVAWRRLLDAAATAADEPQTRDAAWWPIPIVIGVAAASALTAAIGIHEIIGAFLAGVACPRGYRPLEAAAVRLAGVTRTVLLPVFFAGFGLSVDLGALPMSAGTLAVGAVLLASAVVAKVVGPGLAARLTGLSWREAGALGALLNARGLTELVVLQIGWQAGLIDRRMLAMLVIVTLVTTAMSEPLLRLLRYRRLRTRDEPGVAAAPQQPPANAVADAPLGTVPVAAGTWPGRRQAQI